MKINKSSGETLANMKKKLHSLNEINSMLHVDRKLTDRAKTFGYSS